MTLYRLFLVTVLAGLATARAQTTPVFGPEIPVTINGLTFDAMEPSVSADGNFLFFNSRNDGITTSLHYAVRVNDVTFTYAGPLAGANQTVTPRLDAVASSDQVNRFYWTSVRDYPAQMENCFRGQFNGSDIVNIGRLHGTFYIYTPGWIMMDGAIDHSGSLFYFTNAFFGPAFNSCGNVPCVSRMGVAQKQNDTTFNKLANSDSLFKLVNDTSYAVYAPCVSANGLELYFTRFLRSNVAGGTQMCVAARTSTSVPFGAPAALDPFSTQVPEGISMTTDMSRIYYHRLSGSVFKIFMRHRDLTAGLGAAGTTGDLSVYPNPGNASLTVDVPLKDQPFLLEVFSASGESLFTAHDQSAIDLGELSPGTYLIRVTQGAQVWKKKFLRE